MDWYVWLNLALWTLVLLLNLNTLLLNRARRKQASKQP